MKKLLIIFIVFIFITVPSLDIDALNRLTLNKLEVFIVNPVVKNI